MPVTPGATIEPGVSTGAQHSNAPQSKAAVNEQTSAVGKNHSNTHVSVSEGHNDGTIKAYTHSTINKSKSIYYHDTREADVMSPETLIAMIKQRYRENDRLSDMFAGDGPSLTLSEGCYINLALVKSVEQKAKEKDQCKKGAQPKAIDTYLERQHLSSFEEIYQPKEALPLAELFVPKASEGSHPIHRVLMLGRAGIGKSTLCHYLANRWATGNGVEAEEAWLQDYDVVLWVRLRELIKFRDDCKEPAQCDVTHFFVHQCLTNTHGFEERSIRAMEQLLADRSKKKLLLLDGFDEVAHLYRDSSDINLQRLLHTLVPETTPSVSKDNNYHVLLTSRPYAVSGLRAEREVENIGLSDENIDAYVKQYFSKLNYAHDQAATRLIEQLRVNPNLRGMSHIPVNLYLLCFQHQKAMEYEDQGEHRLRLQSLTQLYQQLVSDLCQRNSRQRAYEGRIAGLIKDYQLPLQALAELAFEGLKGKGLMLSWPLQEQVFHKHHVISSYEQEVLSLGLMKTIGGITQSQSKAPRYFIHLTFQEFFAALHLVWGLADHSAEENNAEVTQLQEFIQRHKYTPRYQVVFWFAAGLIRDVAWFQKDTALQQRVFHAFWHEGLLAKPLDLTGFGHIPLLTRAFEEGGFFDEEDEVRMDEALQVMARVHQVRCAELLLSDRESILAQRLIPTIQGCPRLRALVARQLAVALNDEDALVRWRAANVLEAINPQEVAVHQALVGLLNDEDVDVRRSAASALGAIKPQEVAVHQVLVGLLNNEDAGVRFSAANVLGAINPQETSVHQALVGLLNDEDAVARWNVANVLSAIKPQDSAVHQALVEALNNEDKLVGLLNDEDSGVRRSVVKALGAIKPQEVVVHQALVGLLNDEKADVRRSAASALGAIKPQEVVVHQALVGLLNDEKAAMRCRAANVLGAISPQEVAVHQALVSLLNDDDEDVRSRAANALRKIKPQETSVHQALVGLLNDENGGVRWSAANVLGAINPQETSVHQALVSLLNDEDAAVRCRAADALREIKPQETLVHQALVGLLNDENAIVRCRAADALGAINPQETSVHQALVGLLNSEDVAVRRSAADALGAIKPRETLVHQTLVGLLNDEDTGVRRSAADALREIKPQETSVHQALVEALNDKDKEVRWSVAKALGTIKPQDRAVHQALVAALKDEDTGVRHSAAKALGAINPQEVAVHQALVAALNDEDAVVRRSAGYALSAIKPQEASVHQALVGALNDKDKDVRCRAAKALGAIKPQDRAVHQALVGALNDKDKDVRRCAAKALGAIKPQETSVHQALVEALKDEDKEVCRSVAKALGAIKPQDRAVHQALVGLLNDEYVGARGRAAEALKEIIDNIQLDTLLSLSYSYLHENKRVWLTPSAYSCWLHEFFNPKTQNESQKATAKLVLLSQLLARFAVDDLQLAITIQDNTMLLCSSRIDLAIKVPANAYSQAALTAFKAALKCEQLFMIFYSIEPQTQSSYDEPIKSQPWQLGFVRKVWSLLQQYRNNNQTERVYYLGCKLTEKLGHDTTLSTVPLRLKIGLISLQAGSQLNERISKKFIEIFFPLCLAYLVRGDFQRLPNLSTSILELNKEDRDDEKNIAFSRFLARAYQASGQSVLARQWFDKAVLQVDVSKAELVLDFAHYCIIQEQPEKALSLLATVLSQLSSDEPNQSPNDTDEESSSSESKSDDKWPELVYFYQELAQCGDKGLQSYSQAKLSTRLLKPKQKKEKLDEDFFKQPMLKLDASQQLTLAYYFKAKAHHMLSQTKECEEALQAFNTSQAATTVTEKQALHAHLSKALTEFIRQPFVPTSSLKKETVTLPKATEVLPLTKNTHSMLTHPGYRMILVGLLFGSFMVTSTLLLVIVLLSCFQSALLSQLLLSLHLTYPLLLLAPACLLGAVFGSVMGWLLSEKSILAHTNNTQLSPATIVLTYMLSGGLLLALVTAAVLTLVPVITSFWVAPPILWLMMSLAPSVGLMLGYLVGCYQVQQGPLSKTHITYLATTFSASLGAVLGIILSGAMTVGFGIVGGGVILGLPILAMYLIPTITILTTAVGYYLTQCIITNDTVQMRESVLNSMQISAPQPGSNEFDACAVSYLRVQETMNDTTALPSASELTQTTELNPVTSVVLS